jgi:hypothetical protein
MARDESWELAAPNEKALAEMREHCHTAHLMAFDPRLHLSYANHRRHDARIIYVPAGPGQLAFYECLACDPPQRFLLGWTDYGERETQLRWLRKNPTVAAQIERSGIPDELIGPAIQAHLDGEVGEGGFAGWLDKQMHRDFRKRRPKDARREDGCQRFLLERRLEGWTVQKAIDALLEMQEEDLDAWQVLTEGKRTVTEPTLERYWGHIPKSVRDAALAAAGGDGSQAPEVKERLLAVLSPSNDLPQARRSAQPGAHAKRPALPPPGALQGRGGRGPRRQRRLP